eukprot:365025-Chlamydomonas_euryale.AAC.3
MPPLPGASAPRRSSRRGRGARGHRRCRRRWRRPSRSGRAAGATRRVADPWPVLCVCRVGGAGSTGQGWLRPWSSGGMVMSKALPQAGEWSCPRLSLKGGIGEIPTKPTCYKCNDTWPHGRPSRGYDALLVLQVLAIRERTPQVRNASRHPFTMSLVPSPPGPLKSPQSLNSPCPNKPPPPGRFAPPPPCRDALHHRRPAGTHCTTAALPGRIAPPPPTLSAPFAHLSFRSLCSLVCHRAVVVPGASLVDGACAARANLLQQRPPKSRQKLDNVACGERKRAPCMLRCVAYICSLAAFSGHIPNMKGA